MPAFAQAPGAVRQGLGLQPPIPYEGAAGQRAYPIQLEPPGPGRVFRVESEEALRQRLRQEARQKDDRADFPRDPDLPSLPLPVRRALPPTTINYLSTAVSYQPLYFEEKNAERYGWELCIFQPVVSTAYFYWDLIKLPYELGAHPPWRLEYNAGYYYPGEPVPYYLYVPRFSVMGAAAQTGTVLGGIAIFP